MEAVEAGRTRLKKRTTALLMNTVGKGFNSMSETEIKDQEPFARLRTMQVQEWDRTTLATSGKRW